MIWQVVVQCSSPAAFVVVPSAFIGHGQQFLIVLPIGLLASYNYGGVCGQAVLLIVFSLVSIKYAIPFPTLFTSIGSPLPDAVQAGITPPAVLHLHLKCIITPRVPASTLFSSMHGTSATYLFPVPRMLSSEPMVHYP